jgi:hypothetical protein
MKTHPGRFSISIGRTILVIALSASTLLFQRCSTSLQPVASGAGDDFPNAKVSVGSLIANVMSTTGEWKDLSTVPDSVDPAIFGADTLFGVVTGDTAKVLQKTASATVTTDTVIWDYSDTLNGIVSYDHIKENWLTISEVKAVVRYDRQAKDTTIITIQGTVHNKISGSTTTYEISDADSNGFLDTAYIIQMTPETGRIRYNAAYGSWGNQTGINDGSHIRLSRLELFYVVGADTSTFLQLSDRDGDGRIYVQGQAVNQIRFVYAYKDPFALIASKPVAGTLVLDGGFAAGGTSRFTADRLGANYLYRDGTSDRIMITGAHRDSLLSGRDTISVALERTSPDRLLYDSLNAQFVLAPAGAGAGYGLARISFDASVNGASIRELRGTFVPDAPMIAGQLLKFTPGGFNATIAFANGKLGVLQGRLSNGVYTLRYTGADGSVRDISYSQDGTEVP